MKDKLLLCGFAFVLMLFSSSIYAQVPCDTGCNANDFSSINYRLANFDGSELNLTGTAPGTPVTAYLWSTFSGQASRYSLLVYFEVIQNGVQTGTINHCWQSSLPGNEIPVGNDQRIVAVTWNYGSELRLRNLYLGWQVNTGAACGCANRAHCFYSSTDLVVETPLVASFEYTSTCSESGLSFEKFSFENTASGGVQPYTLNWVLGNGATPPLSNDENPVVTYSTGGTKTVSLMVVDNLGNTSLIEKEITVNACCNLALSAPDDVNVEYGQSTEPAATGTAMASNNGNPLTAGYSDVITPGTNSHEYTITRTWSVTDACNNTKTDVQIIQVSDNTPADLGGCAPLQIIDADANCAATVPDFTASLEELLPEDGNTYTINQTPAANTSIGIGVHTVILTVSDQSGNSTTCETDLIVNDITAPVIANCPEDQFFDADENDSYLVPDFVALLEISITESCGNQQNPGFTVVQEPAAGTTLGLGTYDVTITVTDASENSSFCAFQVSVESIQTNNFAVCPGIIEVEAIVCFGECTAIVPDFSAYAVLNEGAVSMSQVPAPGTWIKGSGYHTVTLTALDGEGNSSVCESGIYVYSIAMEGCEPAVVDVITGCQATVPDLTQSISLSTVCGEPMPGSELVIVQTPAPGTLLGIGQYPLTFTVKNLENKVVASCSTTITIADDSAPVVSCITTPVIITLKAEVVMNRFGVWRVYKGYLPKNLVTATDNCTPASKLVFSYAQTTFTQADLGYHNVSVEVTDASGNVGTCEIPVIVNLPLKNGEIGNTYANNQNELLQLNVQAYPNPTTGKMWIQIDNLNNPLVVAKVYNSTGSVVFERTLSTDGRIDVDLSGNVEGIYVLKVVADQNEFIHKIILQKR